MVAQGKGSLATQIYDKSQAFVNACEVVNTWEDHEVFSDEEGDGEYIPEYEGNEDEIYAVNKKRNTKDSMTKSGSMANFIKNTSEHLAKKQHTQLPGKINASKVSVSKLGSMAAFTKQMSEHLIEKQPENQLVEMDIAENDQCVEKNQCIEPFGNSLQKVVDRKNLNSMRKNQQRSEQNGNNQLGKHPSKSQQKQQQKAFCRPGSLSAFRELRKKQSGCVLPDSQMENPSTHEGEYDCLLTSINENEAIENEPQLRDQENVVMNRRVEIGHELQSQPVVESPEKAPTIKKH
ncbi:uncharacterized protein LOC110704195 [Chenopodium quinoa]|uniref:uncharacterized protein LOC110704195 n=1 Tax=Chenopodium quinoa TaxID=63459 RepID=UPI000B76E59A|nr:uncharacterized protein LOC110704195 [Chenopodium quinoa]